MKIAFTALLVSVLIRLLFRKLIDLPPYKGRSVLSVSDLENLMPEPAFWELIRSSHRESRGHYPRQCQILREKLEHLPSNDIVAFQRTFTALMAGSYRYTLWEAAYALNGGCSDDCFEYFRSWLIAQGRNKFYWALKYPRILLLIGVKDVIENYEGIAYCASEAYQNKTGSELAYPTDITYPIPGTTFRGAFWLYPELALLAW